jgi:hypothetical protein
MNELLWYLSRAAGLGGCPIIDARPRPAGLIRHARRAAQECPVRDLRLSLA